MFHQPVLLAETVEQLGLSAGDHAVDGTLGGGGHAQAILRQTGPDGQLIGSDLDADAITETRRRLVPYANRIHLYKTNYGDLPAIIHEQFPRLPISAVLLDLGVSSHELQDPDRGFSFLTPDAPLDMRLSGEGKTAADRLNHWTEARLADTFWRFGEERLSRPIAAAIVRQRREAPFETVGQLARLIARLYVQKIRRPSAQRRHPATQVFQALRIAVNDELTHLERALPAYLRLLRPAGRLAVITFHSLEDALVKKFFRRESRDCICPPEFPVCRCGHTASLRIVTSRPMTPSDIEQQHNPRSRSAQLRVAEKT